MALCAALCVSLTIVALLYFMPDASVSALALVFGVVFLTTWLVARNILSFLSRKSAETIKKLKKASDFRKEFLSNVSHELRTPLFAAQGFVQTVLKEESLGKKKIPWNFLKKAEKHLDQLEHLVNDLLTISQAESGVIALQKEDFSLQALSQEVCDLLAERAKEKDLSLRLRPSSFDTSVRADPKYIRQVLNNLVLNAIVYNRDRGSVELFFTRGESGVIHFHIRDSGIGIAEKDKKRIFERFYRVERSRRKRKGQGTGIGLALVKHILMLHDSEVGVESKVGEGTLFSFHLPPPERRPH